MQIERLLRKRVYRSVIIVVVETCAATLSNACPPLAFDADHSPNKQIPKQIRPTLGNLPVCCESFQMHQ